MYFLIEYDRDRGRLVTLRTFADSDTAEARSCRLELELALNRQGIDREVVLLEAATEQDLRRTHRRYFLAISELTATEPRESGT